MIEKEIATANKTVFQEIVDLDTTSEHVALEKDNNVTIANLESMKMCMCGKKNPLDCDVERLHPLLSGRGRRALRVRRSSMQLFVAQCIMTTTTIPTVPAIPTVPKIPSMPTIPITTSGSSSTVSP